MLLMPICAISSVCEFVEGDRVGEELEEEIHGSDPLAQLGAEQALRAQHQHQEEGGEGDAAAHVAAERDERRGPRSGRADSRR